MLCSILIKREAPSAHVVILERNDKVGKKLLVTGNGRCNFSNRNVLKENFHCRDEEFPMKIISKLDGKSTLDLLETVGIYPAEEKNGKLFPLSYQASTVQDILRLHMELCGVKVITSEKVNSVKIKNNKFSIYGNKEYTADVVVIATGGMAMPSSGSDGMGYRFAKELGHGIVEPQPTIVQLKSPYRRLKSLSGVRIDSCARIYVDDELKDEKCGDILFTDYGLSGPPILDLSRTAVMGLNDGKKISLSINLVGLDKFILSSIISKKLSVFRQHESIEIEQLLLGLVNKKLHPAILETLKEKYNLNSLEDEYFTEGLVSTLTDFRIDIDGYKGFGDAQATIGGVSTEDINVNTLESNKVRNLYFIGEVIDVDGDCGGYNLQWAWSSAFVAAKNIVKEI